MAEGMRDREGGLVMRWNWLVGLDSEWSSGYTVVDGFLQTFFFVRQGTVGLFFAGGKATLGGGVAYGLAKDMVGVRVGEESVLPRLLFI
jgi:hypothetical protein